VPDSTTSCGLLGALSVTESVPLMLPAVLGVNVTLIVHVAPDGRLGRQSSVSANSVVVLMVETLRAAVP